jgi:hypothetical protein
LMRRCWDLGGAPRPAQCNANLNHISDLKVSDMVMVFLRMRSCWRVESGRSGGTLRPLGRSVPTVGGMEPGHRRAHWTVRLDVRTSAGRGCSVGPMRSFAGVAAAASLAPKSNRTSVRVGGSSPYFLAVLRSTTFTKRRGRGVRNRASSILFLPQA